MDTIHKPQTSTTNGTTSTMNLALWPNDWDGMNESSGTGHCQHCSSSSFASSLSRVASIDGFKETFDDLVFSDVLENLFDSRMTPPPPPSNVVNATTTASVPAEDNKGSNHFPKSETGVPNPLLSMIQDPYMGTETSTSRQQAENLKEEPFTLSSAIFSYRDNLLSDLVLPTALHHNLPTGLLMGDTDHLPVKVPPKTSNLKFLPSMLSYDGSTCQTQQVAVTGNTKMADAVVTRPSPTKVVVPSPSSPTKGGKMCAKRKHSLITANTSSKSSTVKAYTKRGEEDTEEVKAMKKERNRSHAQKSRQRKKEFTEQLQIAVRQLKDENALLKQALCSGSRNMTEDDCNVLVDQRRVESHQKFILAITTSKTAIMGGVATIKPNHHTIKNETVKYLQSLRSKKVRRSSLSSSS